MTHIAMENVSFGYTADHVIEDLSLSVDEGELITIHGENGSGKSTLLKLMLGQLKPQKGNVKLLGKNVAAMKSFREIGYVPQVQTAGQISFPITAGELVVLNLYEDFGFFKIPKKTHRDKARAILSEMGMAAYYKAPVNELSGGLKQRAMIARAMINNPKILVLDEPTAGVDKDSKMNFLKLIEKLNREKNLTVVIVSHELELIRHTLDVDQAYKMDERRLLRAGI